jgi:hypothetical protein
MLRCLDLESVDKKKRSMHTETFSSLGYKLPPPCADVSSLGEDLEHLSLRPLRTKRRKVGHSPDEMDETGHTPTSSPTAILSPRVDPVQCFDDPLR